MKLHRPDCDPPEKRSPDAVAKQVTFEELFSAASLVPPGQRHGRGRHRRPRRGTWLCLAERVLGGWAPTLRASLLLLVVAMCLLAAAAVIFGVPGVAGYVLGCALAWALPARRPRRRGVLAI
jgi:hypothetical protein